MCKFSIIVPCYNISKNIDTLFDMLSCNGYTDYEAIFVDDCSKDGSFDKMCEKQKKFKNYRVFQTEKNGGPGPARNFGLEKACGEYILFCDADDIFDVGCLPKIDEFLSDKGDAEMVLFPHAVIRGKKASVSDTFSKYKDGEEMKLYDVVSGFGGPFAKIYKTSVIRENNVAFLPRMTGEDVCFVATYTTYVKKAYKMDLVFYKYIRNTSSITHTYKSDWRIPTTFEVLLPIYKEHFPEIEVQRFIEVHLLTKAKQMTEAKCSNAEIREWFKKENQRYPDWIDYTANLDQSIYRRLIYKAMHSSSPVLIKLVMFIRRILY